MLKKDVNTLAEAAQAMWWPKIDVPRASGMHLVTAEQFAVLDQQRQSMN